MINFFGKTLALVHVGMCLSLATLAAALFFNAVDFGWKEPRRIWNDQPNKKEENLLVPSALDKAEAAMRKLVRSKEDGLYALNMAQQKAARIDPWLGKNHLRGMALIERLHTGEPGKDSFEIEDILVDQKGYLVPEEENNDLAFPKMGPAKRDPAINKSLVVYEQDLRNLEGKIDEVLEKLRKVVEDEAVISDRLTGDMASDGTPRKYPEGNIIRPGYHYLVEQEREAQRQLLKELEYLQPLWIKERVDSQLLVQRRDLLLQRLGELRAKGYYRSQSEYLMKQLQK